MKLVSRNSKIRRKKIIKKTLLFIFIIEIILVFEIFINILLTTKNEINFLQMGKESSKMSPQVESSDWINSVKGIGWNYINCVTATNNKEILACGSFSSYSNYIFEGAYNGIDIDNNGEVDKISQGGNDGLIISYDLNGNCNWIKTFGGSENDSLSKIIQTSDRGIVVAGYTSSKSVKLDGQEIPELSRNDNEGVLSKKDAVLLKLDTEGNYIWGIRIGGLADDEIKSVIETTENNLVIVGYYYSDIFNFYSYNSKEVKNAITVSSNSQDGFMASYSLQTGEYKWSQKIGNSSVEVSDVVETSGKLLVSVNNSIIIYNLNGNVENTISIGDKITSLDITANGSIIAGVNETVFGKRWDACIYKININQNNSINKIYTLSGDYDEYVSDVKVTLDGGILFGGWYYSNNIQGEGLEGEFIFEGGDDKNSKGYVIKLNKNNEPEYASLFQGNEIENEDKLIGVTTVTESNDEKIIVGGYFSTSNLCVTNFDKDAKENNKDENNFLIERIGNSEGFIMQKEKIYTLTDLKILKIAKEDKSIKLSGTNFSLYKLVCTEHEKGYHDRELIDCKKEEENTCWKKIGEYITDENGEITINDLRVTDEFRLVETKASDNRKISKGQWKIELESDLIIVTPIGDASTSTVDNGKITIENEKKIVVDLPVTGGIGIYIYIIIGTIITVVTLNMLIYNKK